MGQLVAMVTAAAPRQPSHLLTTNLTDALLCLVWQGWGPGGWIWGWIMHKCVCVQAYTSACSELMFVPPPGELTAWGKMLSTSLATVVMGLFLSLWLGRGQEQGMGVHEYVQVCTQI